MQSVIFREFGEPADVLTTADVPVPEPGMNEVRVRMIASPVNPSDLMTVRGVYGRKPTLPATPGYEGVGVVEAAGKGLLGSFMKGKRVAALNRAGGNWAESVILPANQVVPLSSKLSDEQAATFFVNPATAFVMTQRVLSVTKGQWLMQSAAGSQLGRMVIRLGKEFGFKTLNVVRRAEQAEELKRLGADEVLVFNESQADAGEQLREEVLKLTNNQGVPAAIDPVGGMTGSALAGCLSPGGRLLVYGTLSAEPLTFSSRVLMTGMSSVEGFWLAVWMQRLSLLQRLGVVRKVSSLIQKGVLSSEIGDVFSLDQIADAVRKSEEVGRGGKVLLKMPTG